MSALCQKRAFVNYAAKYRYEPLSEVEMMSRKGRRCSYGGKTEQGKHDSGEESSHKGDKQAAVKQTLIEA